MNEKEQEAAKVELLPCPFCGNADTAVDRTEAGYWYAVCRRCLARSLPRYRKEDGIAGWNTRQHSRLPADGWREINGVEDYPSEPGWYVVRYRDGMLNTFELDEYRLSRLTDERRQFFVSEISHYKRITPPPTEKEER